MTVTTLAEAHAELAGALWWLRGFEAATTSGHDDTVHDLWAGLREVREYLDRMSEGKVRRVGDEKAIIITYAEFERLCDAFRESAVPAEVGHARETVSRVLEEYHREAVAARNLPEIPF